MKGCGHYSGETISRFIDGELPDNQYKQMEAHLANCDACAAAVGKASLLEGQFRKEIDQAFAGFDPAAISQTVTRRTQQPDRPVSWKRIPELLNRKLVLQLASIAVIVSGTVLWYQSPSDVSKGPSAIVTSVDADMGSVMILETETNHHTIIWYRES